MLVAIKSIILLVIWCIAAVSSGKLILDIIALRVYLGEKKDVNFEYYLSSFLIGIVLTIILTISAMLSTGLSGISAFLILLLLTLLGVTKIKDLCLDIKKTIKSFLTEKDFRWSIGGPVILLLFILIFFAVLRTSLPPKSTDELEYHVWQPIQHRYVLENPDLGDLHLWMPRNIETSFFFFRMLSGGFLLSRVFQIIILLLTIVVLLFHFYRSTKQIDISLLSAFVCATALHMFWIYSSTFLIDTGTAGFIIITGVMFLNWIGDKENFYALIAGGLALGLAVGSKYYSLYYCVSFMIMLIPFLFYPKRIKRTQLTKLTVILLATIGVGSAFWYIRNLAVTANPFYPFVFNHPGFSEEQMLELKQQISRIGTPMNALYLIFPFLTSYNPFRSFFYFSGYVAFGAYFFKNYKNNSIALTLFIVSVVLIIQHFQNGIYPRYHISLFVLGSIMGAYTMFGLMKAFPARRQIAIILLLIIAFLNFGNTVWALRPQTAIKYFIGTLQKEKVYRPDSLAAFEINAMDTEGRIKVLSLGTYAYFQFFRPPDKDFQLDMSKLFTNTTIDRMTDKEIIDWIKNTDATHFITEFDEDFAVNVASRGTIENFLRVYKVRQAIINNSTAIPLKNKKFKFFFIN